MDDKLLAVKMFAGDGFSAPIVVSQYVPDVFPETFPDGKPHPAAGQRYALPLNGIIYVSQETLEIVNEFIRQSDGQQ